MVEIISTRTEQNIAGLTKMLKILVIAFLFVVPIFSRRTPNHKHTKKTVIEGIYFQAHGYGRNFSEKCICVSSAVGIDVDFKEFESLYDAYDDCASEVGDYEQCWRDLWEVLTNVYNVRSGSILYLSDKQKTEIVDFLQKYCSKFIDYMKCDDVVSPIYEKCFTIAERNVITVGKASFLQLMNNFCENNVEQLVKVVNTKGLECGLSKGFSCLRDYGVSYDPFSNPTLPDFCRFYNMTINCMGPVFKECELSQTPDTLMRSFFKSIHHLSFCLT